jgi:anti-anti-sigma regulatory factor
MVLRITISEGTRSRAILKLEGKIRAEWADLLEEECAGLLRTWSSVSLDLACVSFVDQAGVEALGRLSRAGAEILCPPGPVASVLEAEGIPVAREAEAMNGGRA